MDTQQIFHNLTMKFLTPHLAKANSEFHLEGPPSIWNNFLQNSQKEIETLSLFKSKLKLKLLFFSNEIIYSYTYF